MLKKLFISKRESELILEKEMFEIEIEKLKSEIKKKDDFLKCKNSLFIKQEEGKKQEENWQEIEEKLKKYYKENNELRESFKQSDKIISRTYLKFSYLIPIEKYLYEARFKKLVEILKNKGNRYIQHLNEYVIEYLSIEDNLKSDLKRKFEKFKNLEINWEMKTHLLKGEKLSKVYSKYRKFINIMLSENKEFISELEGYNFEDLVNKGYSLDEVEELKQIYQDYILACRIENLESTGDIKETL